MKKREKNTVSSFSETRPLMEGADTDVPMEDAPGLLEEAAKLLATQDGSTPIDKQVKEIESQIEHLVRSNREMEEHMTESGHDPDLRQAVGENSAPFVSIRSLPSFSPVHVALAVVSIARRRAIFEDLRKQQPSTGAVGTLAADGVYL